MDPDPYVFGNPESGSGSFHQVKTVRKILISAVLGLLYDLFSLKNNINVPSKSNQQERRQKIIFFYWYLERHW